MPNAFSYLSCATIFLGIPLKYIISPQAPNEKSCFLHFWKEKVFSDDQNQKKKISGDVLQGLWACSYAP